MLWIIPVVLFVVYVIYRLSTINHQLKVIAKHLDVKDEESDYISNEEIEKELEDERMK